MADSLGTIDVIDGRLLHKMLTYGSRNLAFNVDYLNEINVFPVSDSDTGTNMNTTLEKAINTLTEDVSFCGVMSKFVSQLMMSSRGNSGSILAQYFYGIYEHTKEKQVVTVDDLSLALQHAYLKAFKAVAHPSEGTMLTVMRRGADVSLHEAEQFVSVESFLGAFVNDLLVSTIETVSQLDALRVNNVVDSGALGLFLLFDGMHKATVEDAKPYDCANSECLPKKVSNDDRIVSFFRYCTEFLVRVNDVKDTGIYVNILETRGDSVFVAFNDGLLKVHVHTNKPQEVMDLFAKYGNVVSRKVDDLFMTKEFEKLSRRKHPEYAVVVFTSGEGNAATFERLGADVAFCVPFGYCPDETELEILIELHRKSKLLLLSSDKSIQRKLARIKHYSRTSNLYVADTCSLSETMFLISMIVFQEKFQDIVASLEHDNRQPSREISIKSLESDGHKCFATEIDNNTIVHEDLIELLIAIWEQGVFAEYSTIVCIEGNLVSSEDSVKVGEYLSSLASYELSHLYGGQHDSYFTIGAY